MTSSEPPVSSEPALPEAAEHEHEHHEHDHSHDHGEASGVLKTTTGCKDDCAKCLACTRKPKIGE